MWFGNRSMNPEKNVWSIHIKHHRYRNQTTTIIVYKIINMTYYLVHEKYAHCFESVQELAQDIC